MILNLRFGVFTTTNFLLFIFLGSLNAAHLTRFVWQGKLHLFFKIIQHSKKGFFQGEPGEISVNQGFSGGVRDNAVFSDIIRFLSVNHLF
jgi:hypothetical protein